MKKIELGNTGLKVPNISLGFMRVEDRSKEEVKEIIQTALDLGINFFDHADIYGKELGSAEKYFGEVFSEMDIKRQDVILQSKVGIRGPFENGIDVEYYDFSKEHLLNTVDDTLERLQTDYLDVLLLHRNDALFLPEEVAEVFDELERKGKVKHFGVSNHTPLQIELLKTHVNQDLVANQVQFSAAHSNMVGAGFNVNRTNNESVMRDSGILDYSRLHDMTIQPWSPVRGPNSVFFDDPDFDDLNKVLKEIGGNHGINKEATAIAWLLRHPAKMQVILGTMTPERIKNYASASEITLTREEWYEIYRKAGNYLP